MAAKPRGPQKVKGTVQMVAGGVLTVAGVAMCVLPGPGLACIAGGVMLVSRGQRNFSGRTASRAEEKLEAKATELGDAAKKEAAQTAQNVAREAPVVAGKVARTVGRGAAAVGKAAAAGGAAAVKKMREKHPDGIRHPGPGRGAL